MGRSERDPERPDPLVPARQRIRETLIERQIREAMDEGAFDHLPHQGRRLPLEDDSAAGDWAMAHRMLRNAGAAPPWIEADKVARASLADLERLLERAGRMSEVGRARARREVIRLVAEANRAIERVNVEAPTVRQHRRVLDQSVEIARFDRAARGEPPGVIGS
ncbi:MAG TPA: DUF1992 domain-containing protein [Candidatus Limnocylindrales bacterium]|nr:DUF1992 domain-containing protein [Candidatus Limnocylindrales bacterium]